MSSIDLVILGMVMERPQSAYELQKDVEGHHFQRWTRISIPSVYKKVLQLKAGGYLRSESACGRRLAEKTVYHITERGRAYFAKRMADCAGQPVSFLFDFNVVIANLPRLEKAQALARIAALRESIERGAAQTAEIAAENSGIPLVGEEIFEQQRQLGQALLAWLDRFEARYRAEA